MFVADMDFASPPAIVEALRRRLEHPVFGYENPSARLTGTVVDWMARRYNWQIEPQDIIFLPGLVAGINLVIRSYGKPGDEVAVFTPSYPPFLSSPVNNGLVTKQIPMAESVVGGGSRFDLDFDAFERALTPKTSLYIQCHPHNPTGREYLGKELERLGKICIDRNIVICSDEIHCDLTLDGRRHLPMACVSPEIAQNCVTLMAPSKTFNIPGLGVSFAIVQNPVLRERMNAAAAGHIPHVNAFGLAACEAAYSECDHWLEDLRTYLAANRDYMLQFIAKRMPQIEATRPEATYLSFLDCRETKITGSPYLFFLEKAGVALNDGTTFGAGFERHVRLNFGCPRSQLTEALERMANALDDI